MELAELYVVHRGGVCSSFVLTFDETARISVMGGEQAANVLAQSTFDAFLSSGDQRNVILTRNVVCQSAEMPKRRKEKRYAVSTGQQLSLISNADVVLIVVRSGRRGVQKTYSGSLRGGRTSVLRKCEVKCLSMPL